MVFQPIASTQHHRVVGYEALVRSQEPTVSGPQALFSLARRLRQHTNLTSKIYAEVARMIPHLPTDALAFINVEPADIVELATQGGSSPLAMFADRIVLEVTERERISAVPSLVAATHALRQQGYKLAIDDLGEGYAGLCSITQLHPNYVKLDRSLVSGIDSNPVQRRVVMAVTSLCADLGMQTIAEGVETEAELNILPQIGADLMQGYFIGRPAPLITSSATACGG